MFTIWIHVKAFFAVVVVSCAHPANWQQCIRVDQWLIPDLVHAWQIKTGEWQPYQSEKEYLECEQKISSIKKSDNCDSL